uniref:Transmembrane protein n=1 Tax=Rhabditophanes sp. KR3021 TaxID=114890 RepID=A0AC35UIN4_9BILA
MDQQRQSRHRSRFDNNVAMEKIVEGVEGGIQTIIRRTRTLSADASKVVQNIQQLTFETQSVFGKFVQIMKQPTEVIETYNLKELEVASMIISYGMLAFLIGSTIATFMTNKLVGEVMDPQSLILFNYFILPVLLWLKYIPINNAIVETELLTERVYYMISTVYGICHGILVAKFVSNHSTYCGLINAVALFGFFRLKRGNELKLEGLKLEISLVAVSVASVLASSVVVERNLTLGIETAILYGTINFIASKLYQHFKDEVNTFSSF